MEVLFTPSAHRQALDIVAHMVAEDRDAAARFLDAMEQRLQRLAEDQGEGDAVAPGDQVMEEGGVRLCYWVRAGALWVVALMPAQERVGHRLAAPFGLS